MSNTNDFYDLVISTSPKGEGQYYVQKRAKRDLTVLEKAYAASLFSLLAEEYLNELTQQIGEERTYLITEYQKISIMKLQEVIKSILKKVDDGLKSKNVTSSLDFIKDKNKDLDGFQES